MVARDVRLPEFWVYSDENAAPRLLPEQNEEYTSVPLPEVIHSVRFRCLVSAVVYPPRRILNLNHHNKAV